MSASAAKLIVIRELQSKNIALVFTNLHQEVTPAQSSLLFCPNPGLAPMGLVTLPSARVPKRATTQYREPESIPWTAETAPSPNLHDPPADKKIGYKELLHAWT